jgi:hypothetical protein
MCGGLPIAIRLRAVISHVASRYDSCKAISLKYKYMSESIGFPLFRRNIQRLNAL